MWGSAAVIGLEMLPILGRADEQIRWDLLEPPAIALGTAFQLTNFLRDVGEDLRARPGLPAAGVPDAVRRRRATGCGRGRADEPVRNLLAWEIERARGYYRRSRTRHRAGASDAP